MSVQEHSDWHTPGREPVRASLLYRNVTARELLADAHATSSPTSHRSVQPPLSTSRLLRFNYCNPRVKGLLSLLHTWYSGATNWQRKGAY